jgi:N-acetylmuramoyl-L-alanine amidase
VPASVPEPVVIPVPVGESIVVCGQAFPIGAPVVLFSDPDGFDARRTEPHFGPVAGGDAPASGELRYAPGRVARSGEPLIDPGSRDLAALGEVIDQLVLHYDVCGTSARCFRVLQDVRGLSVHFMLDIDGTLYQSLDLRDQAWHASAANPRSIGIEIANIGAYPPGETPELDRWSAVDARGLRLVIPEPWQGRVRTPNFVGRPSRAARIRGPIHGEEFEMLDLTPEQYDTLVSLTVALCRIFPKIRPHAPRDHSGVVRTDALSEQELARFGGILGHHHLTRRKIDPGPAFRWESYLERVQRMLRSRAPGS